MMKGLLIKNASELVTCNRELGKGILGVVEDGAVYIEDGLITDLGQTTAVLERLQKRGITGYESLDAGGKPVLPGFIDPHTHFVFGGYRAEEFNWRLQGKSYLEIMEKGGGIVNTVAATRAASLQELKESAARRLELMLSFGVTTVEGKTGYGLDLRNELKQLKVMQELNEEQPIEVVMTFLGAHALPPEYRENRSGFVELLLKEILPAFSPETGVEFCDVFCDQGAFTIDETRSILLKARELGLKAKIHADEIASTGGAILAAEVGAVSADHLLKVSREGIDAMVRTGVVPVLLPITAFSLKEEYAPARRMLKSGLPVALATDLNPGSCYSGSLPLLLALAALYMGMTTEEVILGVTINAARALNRGDRLGSIEKGKQGDLIILNAPSYQHLTYHLGVNQVERVIKKGELVV